MPSPRTKTAGLPKNGPANKVGASCPSEEVLTLPEAAAYLRVSAADVLRMVRGQGLPARRIGDEWRFLKAALQAWLGLAPAQRGLLSHIGALKDDPFREEMLQEVYARRGRPETEER